MRAAVVCALLCACNGTPRPPLLFESSPADARAAGPRFDINIAAIDAGSFRFELEGRTITPTLARPIRVPKGTLVHGTFGKKGSLVVARIGNAVAGVVRDGGIGFEIVPFKGGHRVVRRSWKPPLRPRHDAEDGNQPPPSPPPPPSPISNKPATIEVLFAYTKAAEEDLSVEGVAAIAHVSTLALNLACIIDGSNVWFAVDDIVPTPDDEDGKTTGDLYNDLDDGKRFEEAYTVREESKADILVVIADIERPEGEVPALGRGKQLAEAKNAYAVVDHNDALWNLTIPHEVGHIMGSRHEQDDREPYEFGHAYSGSNGRTIVSDDYCANPEKCPLYPIWSSPNEVFGETFGDDKYFHDAQVIRIRAHEVSKFR
jgi:hypothetical protein